MQSRTELGFLSPLSQWLCFPLLPPSLRLSTSSLSKSLSLLLSVGLAIRFILVFP